MTSQKLQAVREAVTKAVPSIKSHCPSCGGAVFGESCRPIRLADVLAAMEKVEADYFIDMSGTFVKQNTTLDGDAPERTDYKWNLLDDDLSHQTPETIDFLYEILCTGK